MDPRPAGPLYLFEKFLATENVVVVDRGEAADVTIKLLPLSASASEIVESNLSQAQHVLSPKLPDQSIDRNDERHDLNDTNSDKTSPIISFHFVLFTKICVSKSPSLQLRVLPTFLQLLQWQFLNCNCIKNPRDETSQASPFSQGN